MAKRFSFRKSITLLLAVVFVVASFCVTQSFAAEPTNYVTNGSFTPGTGGQWGAIPGWNPSIAVGSMDLYLGDWNYGNASNLPDGVYLALRKETNPGSAALSVSQTVANLPAGVYKLSAWMWAQNNVDSFTIAISDGTNTKTLTAVQGDKGYKETEIEITSGSATITISADNTVKTAFMDALADDVKLVKVRDISAAEPVNLLENGSFTPGTGGQWGAIPGWTPSIAVGSMDLYLGDWSYGNPANLPDGIYLALRKETNPGSAALSVSQTVSNLPHGVYKLSAWMWAQNNTETFTITITDGTNSKTLSAALGDKGYKETEIEIASGSATVTISANNANKTTFMDALADDLKLVKLRDITNTPLPSPSASASPSVTPSASASATASATATATSAPVTATPGATNTPTGDASLWMIALVVIVAASGMVYVSKKRRGWNV
ncbi:MAG: hypothetical protein IKU26_08820 [Clostridia bacterium]|nr:hypothetical protein [Clostridia bacterium]